MDTKVKIPFAKKNGRIVHISEVENGLSCDCHCCKCGAQLVAKNNVSNIKEAHFAHYNSADCGISLETSIHKAAKQYLSETKKIVLPDVLYYDKNDTITFEKVELEETIPYKNRHITVDALGHLNAEKKIIVEFAFTHFSSEKKKQIINELRIPAIEVILNKFCTSFNDIKRILQESWYKNWLYHPLNDNPGLSSVINQYKTEIDAYKQKMKTLEVRVVSLQDTNRYLQSEVRDLNLHLKNSTKGLIAEGFIGNAWGPKLEKPISLLINKDDLEGIKTDKQNNFRLIIFNSIKLDKTKSNLKIFVDKEYFQRFDY